MYLLPRSRWTILYIVLVRVLIRVSLGRCLMVCVGTSWKRPSWNPERPSSCTCSLALTHVSPAALEWHHADFLSCSFRLHWTAQYLAFLSSLFNAFSSPRLRTSVSPSPLWGPLIERTVTSVKVSGFFGSLSSEFCIHCPFTSPFTVVIILSRLLI